MFGVGIPLLLLIAIIAGIALWTQHSRAATTGGAADQGAPKPPRRVSLLAEAVGYIGTILVVAGAVAGVGQRWGDIPTGGRIALLGFATLLFLGIGFFVRTSTEPAYQRLAGVTWAVSVAAFAGGAAVVTDFYDAPARTAFLAIATTSTAYAAVLWLLHQHGIQQAVLYIGILLSAASIITRAVDGLESWMIVLPLWAIGVAWAAGGWWRRIPPWFVAVPLGLLTALIAPSASDVNALRFGLGIGTAAVVMALGVAARFIPGLSMGSVAMLGYVIGAVTFYFGDTLGVPASLAVAGLVILTLAAAASRWHWFRSTRPPAHLPPTSDDDASRTSSDHDRAA